VSSGGSRSIVAVRRLASRIPGLRDRTRPLRRWIRARLPAGFDEVSRGRIARYPKLATFANRVDAALRSPLPGAPARCARPFEELVRSGFIAEFVDAELARMIADPPSIASLQRHERGIPILQTAQFSLRLVFFSPPSADAPITSVARSTLLAPVGKDAVMLETYAMPARRVDRYRPDDRARAIESRSLEAGTTVTLLRRRHAYRLLPAKRTVVLILDIGATDPFTWQYDRSTLAPRRGVPGDLSATRLVETLRLISVWGDASFMPLVEELFRHSSHAVRWAALQTAWKIAPERPLKLTARATRDPHPDLRAVAHALAAAPDDAAKLLQRGGTPWP
jgi:hypothetical protein